MSRRIEDYALIGDCETAALVSKDGSIDWLCWPRFDSGACFAALLGTPTTDDGASRRRPIMPRVTRRYRPGTLILETTFETADGDVTLIDFMPLRGEASDLVRLVGGITARVAMSTELICASITGARPWVRGSTMERFRAIAGPDMVVLRTPLELHGER